MPIGVPINVAIVAISRLPTMALSNPPSLPGGGVVCVNSVRLNALKPFMQQRDQYPGQPEQAERHGRAGDAQHHRVYHAPALVNFV